MVALQTSHPDNRPSPNPRRKALGLVPKHDPQDAWSPAHPAVRSARGQLHAVQRQPRHIADPHRRAALGLPQASGAGSPPVAKPAIRAPRMARGRPSKVVYLRRRIVAAMLLLALMWAAVALAAELVGGSSGQAGASDERRSHVVVPGDTWWTLASELDRPGDIRDTIAELVELNGGEQLPVGERVVLPAA